MSSSQPVAASIAAETPRDTLVFRVVAGVAVLLQLLVIFGNPELHGGEDLVPHLRLIERMGEAPGLHNVYAPAYHVLGALLSPLTGLAIYPRLFALLGAVALMAGFRVFQRAAGLPSASSAVFCLLPYTYSLSWCIPKIEAAGYALTLLGLACLLRRRWVALVLVLAATFLVHTAAALLLGLAGGVLALARNERFGLLALACGTVLASPLFIAHMASGCSAAQALLFSQDDYLRGALPWSFQGGVAGFLLLAGPLTLALAVLGARGLWQRDPGLAVVCAVLVGVYLNEIWLEPFGIGTTLDLRRGLTVLAIPVSAAAGVALAAHPRWLLPMLGALALVAAATIFMVVPGSCYVRVIDVAETREMSVQRCVFRWTGPAYRPGFLRAPAAPQAPR